VSCRVARLLRPLSLFFALFWLAPLARAEPPAENEPTPKDASEVLEAAPAVAPELAEANEEVDYFEPPQRAVAEADWLRLKSGGWIRGKIEYMRKDDLTFDADEIDDLVISWDDIRELRSPAVNRYVFEPLSAGTFSLRRGENIVLEGPAVMKGDTVTVVVAGVPTSLPRARLIAILEGEQKERNFWEFGVGLGFTGRAGNTQSVDLSANAYVKRETNRTRWNTKYLGAFASVDGDTNTQNHRLSTQFDYFYTRRLFLIVPKFDYFNDRFQNIEYRLTPAAGVGYDFLETSWLTWGASAAAGYQYQKFRQPTVTGKTSDGTFVFVLGTHWESDITDYLDFDFLYGVALGVPDTSKTTHHGEAVLSFDIWGPLDFDVSFVFDRQENPPTESNGTQPKKNDFRMTVGLGIDF